MMSHMVEIDTKLTSLPDILAAASEVGATVEQNSSQRFYSGDTFTGTVVRLKGWKYGAVIDSEGALHFDNYNGTWGKQDELEKFQQQYTLAAFRRATPNRYKIKTKAMEDGRIHVSIF